MERGKKRIFVLLITIVISGCTSTWEDDDSNWQRIYNQQKPEYVKIIHSRYTRLKLLNTEFWYFFETTYNSKILNLMLSNGDLVQVKNPSAIERSKLCPALCPIWFAPEPLANYEVWTGSWKKTSKHKGYFKLFIDKEKKYLFWCDSNI
ncbi:MAG: hypothetical protein JSS79_17005 [Bacteroidetes bacterium]|nr:hypothetical protein [Bacteroidota bacterium]